MEAVTTNLVWPNVPFPALITAAGSVFFAAVIVIVARYFDVSGGLFTISAMVIIAFIAATIASMVYNVPQTPTTEILVGALATSVGAIIAFWVSGKRGGDK